jgi:hypothetical protein
MKFLFWFFIGAPMVLAAFLFVLLIPAAFFGWILLGEPDFEEWSSAEAWFLWSWPLWLPIVVVVVWQLLMKIPNTPLKVTPLEFAKRKIADAAEERESEKVAEAKIAAAKQKAADAAAKKADAAKRAAASAASAARRAAAAEKASRAQEQSKSGRTSRDDARRSSQNDYGHGFDDGFEDENDEEIYWSSSGDSYSEGDTCPYCGRAVLYKIRGSVECPSCGSSF